MKRKRRAEAAKEREQRQKRRAEAAEEREKRQKIATQNTAGPAGSPSRTKTQEPPASPPDKSTDSKEYLDFDDDDIEKLKKRYADLEKEDLRLHADQISQDQNRYAEIVRDGVASVHPGGEAGAAELYSGKLEHMKQKERDDFEEVHKILRNNLDVVVSILKSSE